MAGKIIDGKNIAATIRSELKLEVDEYVREKGRPPGLSVILVGDDPASQVYVSMKERGCREVGIYSEIHRLSADVSKEAVLHLIETLNQREDIHGILVQLPLPAHIDEKKVIESVVPEKDVDGFHPQNAGRLLSGSEKALPPCTPAGIMELLKRCGEPIQGKHAVVVGRSNIVGKPAALLLLQENATVTIAHSKTTDLPVVCREADILVVAVGIPKLIGKEHVKPGAVVIDVGVNRLEEGLVGDVDFDEVKDVASYITPVPGGVGPMTIAMLLKNTLYAARNY